MRRIATAALALAALLPAAACGAGTGTAATGDDAKSVTVYSADGLGDWYKTRFAAFEKKTGISVQLVESGSSQVVTRMKKERSRPQADIAVTLPPFVQKAEQAGLLQPYTPAGGDKVKAKDPDGHYIALANNYLCFIYNPEHAKPAPKTFQDLLAPRFKGKLQYSTPGQAGDGTAVLLHLQHVMGEEKALDYLKRLQENNVGPSASTGRLQPKVSRGELHVANGDLQMNLTSINLDGSTFEIFFPADASGKRSTLALPYSMGLAKGAPHEAEAKKLMDYLLSPEAQRTLMPEVFGLPVRSDVTGGDANSRTVAELLKGVEIWTPDWDRVATDLDADIAAYNEAIGG